MDSIISSLQGSLANIVPVVVLLGLLIFVHELGHFLVAKYYKVRVEVFSLGFGPKLFKFKRGDTVYALSAIPLGGYVKMFGDDPTAEVGTDQKQFAFTHKPVGQRIAIVLAGPLMNLFFAILLFAGVANLGEQALAPKLGDIEQGTAAYSAGFRSGDTILSVSTGADKSLAIKTFDEFQHAIESNADKSLSVEVARATDSGQRDAVQVTPRLAPNKNVLSWDRQVGEVDGISASSRASAVGVRDPQSLAAQAGLKTGDIIQSINGVKVSRWRELNEQLAKSTGDKLELEIERGLLDEKPPAEPITHKVALTIPTEVKGQSPDKILGALGIEFPELYLANVEKGSPAESAGLKRGDRLVAIDEQPVQSFEQVVGIIRAFGQKDKEKDPKAASLAMTVQRDGQEIKVMVAPNMKERMNPHAGKEERRYEVGIRPLIVEAPPASVDLQFSSPVAALERGISQTWKWTNLTILSFWRLIQNEVSPKNIGGLISIGQMAKRSWQVGPSQFLNVMAIISINLFILNLLPVPVLDGGHLVFYSIEALRGAPLSMRKMEIAQQVGLVLLLGLMVFALFNDVSRLFN